MSKKKSIDLIFIHLTNFINFILFIDLNFIETIFLFFILAKNSRK